MSRIINQLQKGALEVDYKQIGKALSENKTQAYTMLILSLLTISFFGLVALKPTLTTIAQRKRQVEDSRKLDNRLSDKINQLDAAQKEYALIAPFVPKIRNTLPDSPNYNEILYDIAKIRNTSSATISSVKIGKVQLDTTKAGEISITFEATGNFPSLEQVINQIVANERLMTFSALNIVQFEQGRESDLLKLDSDIAVHYLGKLEKITNKNQK